jgi:sensor histidine kinase YesM
MLTKARLMINGTPFLMSRVGMKFTKNCIDKNSVIKSLLYTFLFDTLIAIFLTAMKFGEGFPINFIISQCIGLSICTCALIAHCFFDYVGPIVKAVLVGAALITGTICGSLLGSFVSGLSPSDLFERHSLLQLLFLGVMFGSIITYFFSSREQIAESQTRAQEEKIKRLTSEKKAAEANLKLLQAQIEPHFLFNTLSNVLSLLDTDAEKGKSMLMDFVHYLRTSLSKIRGDTTTLGQEIEMIRAYLNIFKVRMGDRLRYSIDIPASMADFPIPPMLIQPLVENAIKHGLEPKIEGGEISIAGEEKNGVVRLEIVDTGLGFRQERHSGMGLSNIRDRLESLYGDRSQLILEENQPCGLKATIEVPHGRP